MNRRFSALFIAMLLPLLTAVLLFATRTQAGGGTVCAVSCYSTIQEAVSKAPENTPITVTAGTFSENVNITRSVILVGAGPGLTIIDGQITDTVIAVSGPITVSISGVTIQNGDASLDGGGLLNENGNVTLANSVVQNNIAPIGAGITNDGVMIIDDVIIRDNAAEEFIGDVLICATDCVGGGISNLGVMTITNSTIQSNSAQYGGGIDNSISGSLMLTNVTIEENVAVGAPPTEDPSSGGGLANLGTVTITNSTIRNNQAAVGAGIFNEATLTLTGSDVYGNSGNVASSQGGGLYNRFNLTVQTSNIYSNQAGTGGGGGINSESGDVAVMETAVYSNTTTGSGAGILNNVLADESKLFIILNSTISGNNASGGGGGLRNAGFGVTMLQNVTLANNTALAPTSGRAINKFGSNGSVTVRDSIITGATPLCSGTVTSNGYNLASDADASCGLSGTADLPNITNPLLGPLQNNGGGTLTHALLLGSPAIDSGSAIGCPATDQRGIARPFGSSCDRGAYEFNKTTQSVYLPFVIRP